MIDHLFMGFLAGIVVVLLIIATLRGLKRRNERQTRWESRLYDVESEITDLKIVEKSTSRSIEAFGKFNTLTTEEIRNLVLRVTEVEKRLDTTKEVIGKQDLLHKRLMTVEGKLNEMTMAALYRDVRNGGRKIK